MTVMANGKEQNDIEKVRYPLYEDYSIINDYRLNQTILDAAKFGFIGALFGGLIGYPIDGNSDFPIITFLAIYLGGFTGLLSGGIHGYSKGKRWNEFRNENDQFMSKLRLFGMEFGYVQGIKKQGGSLGLSFRDIKKDIGKIFDEIFDSEKGLWSHTNANTSFRKNAKKGLWVLLAALVPIGGIIAVFL